MERRTFLSWVGVGFLASSLPVAIAACSSEQDDQAASPTTDGAPRTDGFVVVGAVSALETNGFVSGKVDSTPVIVVRSPEDSEKLVALNAKCTHQGCPVDWDKANNQFACDCHGSKFNPDGTVANGPADKPLASVEVKMEPDSVLVKIS